MKTGVYLSYKGLGANLLHLSYCHELAKKFGPVIIITLCDKLEEALRDDPLIYRVIYLNKYQKKLIDVFKLSEFLKSLNLINLLIFYPSLRIFLAGKIARIKNVYSYKFYKKKKLHLVNAAKKLTEEFLQIKNCKTETTFFIKKDKIAKANKEMNNNSFKIVIGAGSSGPTVRWGSKNYINLINKLNEIGEFFFIILCGPYEKEIEYEIIKKIKKKNYLTLSDKSIYDLIPYLCAADMYIGNDSFGSHITAQSGKKSVVFLLDAPKAYTDYSSNYIRLVPEGYKINDITHGTNADPNLISVEKVIETINKLKS